MVIGRERSFFRNGEYGSKGGELALGRRAYVESRVSVAVKKTFCGFDLSNSPDKRGQCDDIAPRFASGEVTAYAGFDIGLAGVAFAAFQRGAGIFFAMQSSAGEQVGHYLGQLWLKAVLYVLKNIGCHRLLLSWGAVSMVWTACEEKYASRSLMS
jgi:hypothetical protein